jgi:amidase
MLNDEQELSADAALEAASTRVHAFGDDALGEDDATALAARLRSGEVSALEVTRAAIERAHKVNPQLNAIVLDRFDAALRDADLPHTGVFAGIPTFIKDNTDLHGMPTQHGSQAVHAQPAAHDGKFAEQFMAQGFVALGKSRLPEFGFSASTEFMTEAPTRNPWNTGYSSGASSGGAAALVAAGVVPVAHANDGGGSIRIPAACCGLLGLKPSRGRLIDGEAARTLPINVISEGIVARSVRDISNFFAGMEQTWRNPKLPPIGLVNAPGKQRLRIGLVYDSITGHDTDVDTRAAVARTAKLLADLGHHVEEISLPFPPSFADDFTLYWGFLAFMLNSFGPKMVGPGFDASRLDNLTKGLAGYYRKRFYKTPTTFMRLKRLESGYARLFDNFDVMLSPVLAHTTPELGYLSPAQSFESLLARLTQYVAFTPLNNIVGSPAMTLPMGATRQGLPIGVHFSAAYGAERTLLELACEIEQAFSWRRIQDVPVPAEQAN